MIKKKAEINELKTKIIYLYKQMKIWSLWKKQLEGKKLRLIKEKEK